MAPNKQKEKLTDSDFKPNSISDMARKFFLTSLGAIFMTEESIRNAFGEMKLPKEAVTYFFEQAKKQKNELVGAVAGEVSKFFSKIQIHEEIRKVLNSVQIHVETRLTFTPKDQDLKSSEPENPPTEKNQDQK